MPVKFCCTLIAALFLAHSAVAQTPEPITLTPIALAPAALTVVAPDGSEKRYSAADLETMATHRLRTTTPWRADPADFDGVLLADILRENGLHEVTSIRVTAENDFGASFQRDLWQTIPVLVATRVNGRAHTRRERGPIQFVIAMDDYSTSALVTEAQLVWMAARIEPE